MTHMWRRTLECGHLNLYGPWDEEVPAPKTPMVGDITVCEVCPKVVGPLRAEEIRMRLVVNVEPVPFDQYREADTGSAMARQRQADA